MKTVKSLRWRPITGNGLGALGRRASYLAYKVVVLDDVFAPGVPYRVIDWVFAVIASRSSWLFEMTTAYPNRQARYLESVKRRSRGAAEKYERRVRAHFRRYKAKLTEGYTLPAPPTPELRAIYDSAARHEKRPGNPCGTTLRSGFSLSEYHWRGWPLGNLVIKGPDDA